MTIKEVSAVSGLSADTLRYYERIGLIHDVGRDKNGIRDYTDENMNNIAFIKCMRDAGVSIEGLIEYMKLYPQGDATKDARRNILLAERQRLTERMEQMQAALERLDYKLSLLQK